MKTSRADCRLAPLAPLSLDRVVRAFSEGSDSAARRQICASRCCPRRTGGVPNSDRATLVDRSCTDRGTSSSPRNPRLVGYP